MILDACYEERKQQLPSAREENNIFIFSLLLNGNFGEYVFMGGELAGLQI